MSQDFQLLVSSSYHRLLSHFPTKNTNTIKNICLSFACGCLGGIANILSSHPLDTIKVRMQIFDMKLTNCFKSMIKREGLGSLYKGVTSPLFNIPLIYAIYFGSYDICKQTMQANSLAHSMFAGGIAGLAVCAVMTPVELIKCRLQMERSSRKTKRITAIGMARQVIKTQGARELYKGNLITILREIPAGAVYFGSYEIMKENLKLLYGDRQFVPLIAGGAAGLLSWVVSYPQDIVKTKLQCDVSGSGGRRYPQNRLIKDGGIISCAREIWKQNGVKGFVKGFSACSVKAVVAEAATFFVYENMKEKTRVEK